MAFAIARMAKQKGGSVGSSSLHNGRGRETPNADPEREKDNRIIMGGDRPTPELVREVIEDHGGKPRHDSVEAVEVLLTASPEWWRADDDLIDQKKVDQFCEKSKEFLQNREHGGICVKAILHMDEYTPHIHAHVVPITPEGKLSCKHYFGTRGKLSQWQDKFAELVKPLGLERGVEDSRARHVEIKDFYKAIERDHRIRVNYSKLPDPPRMCITKEAAREFKEEFTKALVEQIQEPLKTQRHQAMLARDANSKLKETKKRLEKTQEEASRQRFTNQNLRDEKEQLHQQAQAFLQRAEKAEARFHDVDMGTVIKMLGYKAVPGQQRGTVDFIKPEKNQLLTLFPGGIVYDLQREMVGRNSIAVIQEITKREGNQLSRAEAVGWLSDRCGHESARAASLVAHEQEIDAYLHDRDKQRERGRTNLTPTRDETLTRPEPERMHDRGFDRDGRDRDFGLSR